MTKLSHQLPYSRWTGTQKLLWTCWADCNLPAALEEGRVEPPWPRWSSCGGGAWAAVRQALSTNMCEECSGSQFVSHPPCDTGWWLNLSSVAKEAKKLWVMCFQRNCSIFTRLNSATFRRDLKMIDNIPLTVGTIKIVPNFAELTKFSSRNNVTWTHFVNCLVHCFNHLIFKLWLLFMITRFFFLPVNMPLLIQYSFPPKIVAGEDPSLMILFTSPLFF